ncbi:MAG: hypothetical protein LAO24_21190 [Acidobacteriia bacterium]|nr:hypothetical protein [Terriglobia bacterium]
MDIDALTRSDLDRLIRYAYSGFLLTGILLFLVPGQIHPALEAGGTVVTPLVILAAGAAVYTLYRYVLNELFLSPFVLHPLHALIDWNREVPTNPANFLARYKVRPRLRHQAYVELRRGFFSEEQRRVFDRNHTEATIVWLTAVECTVAGGLLLVVSVSGVSRWKPWLLLIVGVFTLIAAVMMDIRLFQQECRVLRTDELRLPTFLLSRGLIECIESSTSNENEPVNRARETPRP